jgi:hypothetical protein
MKILYLLTNQISIVVNKSKQNENLVIRENVLVKLIKSERNSIPKNLLLKFKFVTRNVCNHRIFEIYIFANFDLSHIHLMLHQYVFSIF